MKRIIPYDDYNQRIPPPDMWEFMGTVTTNIGNSALRHGWKIIEYETENTPSN